MSKLVLGIFQNREEAEDAVDELEDKGFAPKDISIVMRDERGEVQETPGSTVAEGTAAGVATGGALGALAGLLIGVGALAVPGIGGLLVGGPLAAALGLTGAAATTVSGAVTGALAGGLLGALTGLGVPEEEARVYEEEIREGGVLLAIPVREENDDTARKILSDVGADKIRTITLP